MEKSIEDIWKKGFLEDTALVAPQVNDLYGRRSSQLIERFQSMFRLNVQLIVLGALLLLAALWLAKLPLLGVFLCSWLLVIAFLGKQSFDKFKSVDPGRSSYDYVKAFNNQMKELIGYFSKVYGVMYPIFFAGIVLGLRYSVHGQEVMDQLKADPDIPLWLGIPAILYVPLILFGVIFVFFGKSIFLVDMKITYGRSLRKLKETVDEMEKLVG